MVNTAMMPNELVPVFHRAQKYLNRYFREKKEDTGKGAIEIMGERRIVARAAFVSVDFFKTVANMYGKEKEQEAFDVARQLLVDIARTIGREDAVNLQRKTALREPVGKHSVGPARVSPAGWLFVDIHPESNLSPDDDFFLFYDHPSPYEAAAWLEAGIKSAFPVCAVNAGYCAGWCGENFGVPLEAIEITCRARGDEACCFIMAPPSRIEGRIADCRSRARESGRRITRYMPPDFLKGGEVRGKLDGRRVEESMARDRGKFRLLFDAARDPILLMDDSNRYIDCNEAAVRIFGATSKVQILMQHPADLSPEYQPDGQLSYVKAEEILQSVFELSDAKFEWTHRRLDGTEFVVEVSLTLIPMEDRKVQLVHWRDITDRKRSEKALRGSEEQVRQMLHAVESQKIAVQAEKEFTENLLRNSAVPTFVLDRQHRVILWNRACEELTGVKASSVVGTDEPWRAFYSEKRPVLADIVIDGDFNELPACIDRYSRTSLTPEGVHAEGWYPALNGRERYIYLDAAPVRNADGEVIAAVETIRDITERKRLEEELAFKNVILSTQLENSIEGVLVVGEDGAIISYNRRFIDMWGIPPEVAESMSDELALRSVQDKLLDPEGFLARVRYLYEHKDEKSSEEIAFKDGRIFDRYSAPMLGADGKNYGRVWYFRDITGHKQAEERRLQLEARLQEMQKLESLKTLAGGVAHDFNTVLTAIIGYCQLARMQAPPSSPLDTYLVNIEHAAERAARLADQMLAYSGKGRGRVEKVELSRLIEAFYPLLATIAFKPFKLRYLLTPDLPPIEADPAQLRQVITALVANAAEAIGENDGTITIRTGVITADRSFLEATTMGEELPEGEYVFLEVTDTGSGITPEIMTRVFDPFFSTKFVGRGLGLAAVHGIVRGHRGTIMVDSRPGEGTSFRILFPSASSSGREPAKVETAFSAFWHGTGKVLVVDDEPVVREIVTVMLEELGFTVLTAGDGREGLALFRERSGEFVAAFVDLTMPSMEGKGFVRQLLGIKPDLKVVLMSGCMEDAIPSAFVADGIAGFLQKPFKTRELKAVLGVLLNYNPLNAARQ